MEFRPSGDRADAGVWLASVGDWGYGINVPGVRIQGNWIQLFGSPLPSESWVDGGALMAHAASIEGELVSLPALPATYPDGTTRPIVPGSYLIEQIRDSTVIFRAEVASDYSCGEERRPPAVMPPSLRATAEAFFDSAGLAVFSETYSRGC
jgi:hypothetical protein